MFGSLIIDTFLGLVLTYSLLSLCCMTINEWFAACFQLRAETLKKGLSSMIDDPSLVTKIYNHPIVFGLWQSSEKKKIVSQGDMPLEQVAATVSHDLQQYCRTEMLRPPSYIPPKQLVASIIDLIRSVKSDNGDTTEDLREGIQKLGNGPFKYALLSMLDDANGNVDQFRDKLECWFDDGMDRISGWYRRHMQWVAFGVGFAVTIACNADTFQIINGFYRDAALRGTTINVVAAYSTSAGSLDVSNVVFPMGWTTPLPTNCWGWTIKALGWLMTSVALSLGASFWFDVLNKVVRLTGKKPGISAIFNKP